MRWNLFVYERFDVSNTIRRFYVSTEEQQSGCRRSWQAGSLSEVGGEGNCLANRPPHEWQLFTSASNITWACCCLLLAAVSTMCHLMQQSLAGRETEITCCVTLRTRWPLVTKALCARMNVVHHLFLVVLGGCFDPPPPAMTACASALKTGCSFSVPCHTWPSETRLLPLGKRLRR